MTPEERALCAQLEDVRQSILRVLRENGQIVSADAVTALTVDEILEKYHEIGLEQDMAAAMYANYD